MVFVLSAFWWRRIRGLRKLPDGKDWLWSKLGLALIGGAMLSKPLIQIFCWRGGAVFLLCSLVWGQIMTGVMVVMVTSFKRTYTSMCGSQDCFIQCPWPHGRSLSFTSLPETPGHSQESLALSFIGSLLLSPGSWCSQGFVCALQKSVSTVLWKFCNQISLAFKVKFPGVLNPFAGFPGWEIYCGP